MTSTAFTEEPVALITFSEAEDQLQVNDDAVRLLQQLDGPVAVIAMAGLYRTGKSSMLNWLLGRPSGFRVGPTVERCTRGIWLWGQPVKRKLPSSEEEVNVLVLDTEGLGGLEASQQYDARIFSLALLLCSTLVYNSQGSVDEKAINGLSFIANLAKHIKISGRAGDAGAKDEEVMQFHQFFPSFLWIVRDFTLELVDEDGDPITSKDYLENALAEQARIPANMERNRIRSMLKDFFRERDCVTMVRPVHDEGALQQVDQLDIDDLRPEFQEQLSSLQSKVFNEFLKPKTLQNRPLNGSMFAGLLRAYVEAINSGGVPVITSAWDGVTAGESRKALHTASETFKTACDNLDLPLDDEELQSELKTLGASALERFRDMALGDSASKLEKELASQVDEIQASVYSRNAVESKDMCDRLLQTLYNDMIQPMLTSGDDGFRDMQQFTNEWSRFRDAYLEQAKGSAKLESLLRFSEAKYAEAMRVLLSKQEEGYEKQMRTLQQDVAKVQEELGSVGGREQIYKEQLEQLQQTSSQAMNDKAKHEAEVEAHKERISELEEQLKERSSLKPHEEMDRQSERASRVGDGESGELQKDYERVLREKQRQETEMARLQDECDNLRRTQKGGCCVVM